MRLGSFGGAAGRRDPAHGKAEKGARSFTPLLAKRRDATLKRMNRHYTADEYRTIVRNLRAALENAAITTDLIVGFAGETDEEFAKSLAFAEEIAFAKKYTCLPIPAARHPCL